MIATLLVLASFATGLPIGKPTVSQLRPKILSTTSTRQTGVPSFGSYENVLSDADGNLYFHADTGDFRDPVILRLPHDFSTAVKMQPANDQEHEYQFASFNVTPSGTVWLLCNDTKSHQKSLFAFDGDGRLRATATLEIPSYVDVTDLAVFERGTALVFGYHNQSAPKPLQGKGYAASFNETGVFKRNLTKLSNDVDLSKINTQLREGAAVIGDDGNVYLLSSRQVQVISEGGTILRTLPYNKPDGYLATGIKVSQGWVSITLTKNKLGPGEIAFLVLNAHTGDTVGLYQPDSELGTVMVAFSRAEGFTFMTVKAGRLEMKTAQLR